MTTEHDATGYADLLDLERETQGQLEVLYRTDDGVTPKTVVLAGGREHVLRDGDLRAFVAGYRACLRDGLA